MIQNKSLTILRSSLNVPSFIRHVGFVNSALFPNANYKNPGTWQFPSLTK